MPRFNNCLYVRSLPPWSLAARTAGMRAGPAPAHLALTLALSFTHSMWKMPALRLTSEVWSLWKDIYNLSQQKMVSCFFVSYQQIQTWIHCPSTPIRLLKVLRHFIPISQICLNALMWNQDMEDFVSSKQSLCSGTCKYLALWHLPLCGKIPSNRTLAPGAGHVTQAKPIRAPGPLSHMLPSEPMRGQSSLTTTVRSRKHTVFLLKLLGSNTQT